MVAVATAEATPRIEKPQRIKWRGGNPPLLFYRRQVSIAFVDSVLDVRFIVASVVAVRISVRCGKCFSI